MELSEIVFVVPNLHKYRQVLLEELSKKNCIRVLDGNDAGKKDLTKATLNGRVVVVANRTLQINILSFSIKWQVGLLRNILSLDGKSKVVFQFHSGYINYWIAWIYLSLVKKRPIIWGGGIVRRDLGKTKNKLKHYLKYLVEGSADKVICYGQDYADYILSKGCKGEVVVARNFPNLVTPPNFNMDPYYDIVYVGQQSNLKRFNVLFDSIKILCNDADNDLRIAFVGKGDEYKSEIDNMSEVTWYETLWGPQLSRLLSNSKIIALPGIGGLAVVEGMMCGCFPVSTDGDGTLHSLLDITGGYKLEFDSSVNELVHILQKSLKRKDLNALRYDVYQKTNKEYDIKKIIGLWNKALA